MTEQHIHDFVYSNKLQTKSYNSSEILADGITQSFDIVISQERKEVIDKQRNLINFMIWDKVTDLYSNTYIKLFLNKLDLDVEDLFTLFRSTIKTSVFTNLFLSGELFVTTNILFCYLHNYEINFDINDECITIPIFYPNNYSRIIHHDKIQGWNNIYLDSYKYLIDSIDKAEIGVTCHIVNDETKKIIAKRHVNSYMSSKAKFFVYCPSIKYNITTTLGMFLNSTYGFVRYWPKFILLNFFARDDIECLFDLYAIYLSINDTTPMKYTSDDFYKIQIANLDFWILPLSDEAKTEDTLKDACEDGSFYNNNKNTEGTLTFIENVKKLTIQIEGVSLDKEVFVLITAITIENPLDLYDLTSVRTPK